MAYARLLPEAASGGGSAAQPAKPCMYSNLPVSHYVPIIITVFNKKSAVSF